MNIIWLTPEFPSNKDNIKGIYIYRTVRELAKYYDINVICLYPAAPPILEMIKYWKDWKKIYREWKSNYQSIENPNNDVENLTIKYLHYFRFPRSKFHHIEGWFAYFQVRKYLSKIIKSDSIIHANWIFPAGTLARIISQKFQVPYIVSLMGSDVNRLVEGTVFWKSAKSLLENADQVTAVTDDLVAKCISMNIKIPPEKKTLIDNIYETDRFVIEDRAKVRNLLGLDEKQQVIFFAGALIPLKNVDILIEAFDNVLNTHSNAQLFVAGSGNDEGKLKRLVAQKNIQNKVFFLGSLVAEDLVNYFNAADVFCLQSKSEGLPNVIVESFLCGTPVVASKVGGIPTIVQEGVNGFLVEPNNIEDLKDKINLSLSQRWDRSLIRNSISDLFPEKVIKKYDNVYTGLGKKFKTKG